MNSKPNPNESKNFHSIEIFQSKGFFVLVRQRNTKAQVDDDLDRRLIAHRNILDAHVHVHVIVITTDIIVVHDLGRSLVFSPFELIFCLFFSSNSRHRRRSRTPPPSRHHRHRKTSPNDDDEETTRILESIQQSMNKQ